MQGEEHYFNNILDDYQQEGCPNCEELLQEVENWKKDFQEMEAKVDELQELLDNLEVKK